MFKHFLRNPEGNIIKRALVLYLLGLIPIMIFAYHSGQKLAHNKPINKPIKEGYSYVNHMVPDIQAGIISGLTTFILTWIIWTLFCHILTQWLHKSTHKAFLNHFFTLGESRVITVIHHLFYIGMFLLMPMTLNVALGIRGLLRFFIQFPINYTYIGPFFTVFSYILGYLLIVLLWKVTCELLIVIFRCFEVYYENNKNSQ